VGNLVAAFGLLSTSWLSWVFGLAGDEDLPMANGIFQSPLWECLVSL